MKKQTIFFAYVLFFMFFSCQKENETEEKQSVEMVTKEFTDDLDKKINIPFPPKRVIGLAPSLTEILFKICPDSQIVGKTQNCNFPNECLAKKIINTYPLDLEGLLILEPDLVLVTEGITSLSDINKMSEIGLNVFYLKRQSVSELVNSFSKIGEITGNTEAGKKLSETTFMKIEDLKNEVENRKTVLALASNSPIYVYGNNTLFTEKIFIAGGENALLDSFSSPFPEVNSEYILKLNPDIILGGSFSKMDSTFFSIHPELRKTKAYKNKNIFEVNSDLMARPSPRIIESIEELKGIIEKAN